MSTHAAHVASSDRLRRVLDVLSDGAEHTTLDVMERAHVCAVNSVVDELRGNGYVITCERRGDRWFYRMETREARRA